MPFSEWHFDIDRYLDPFIPPNRISRLPRPISHFLGHRTTASEPLGNIVIACWAFLGGFISIAVLSAIYMSSFVTSHHGPIIIGSYGAAAILEFNVIESPLSQPRTLICGTFLSALVGVCVTKLFAMADNFEELRWLAGALSVGLSSTLMIVTKTVHPPAGATALLAAVSSDVSGLGWWLLPVTLVSTVVMTIVACLVNNLQRQFPLYWWTPGGRITRTITKPEEKGVEKDNTGIRSGKTQEHSDSDLEKQRTNRAETLVDASEHRIIIDVFEVRVPEGVFLSSEEKGILQILQERLRDGERTSDTEFDAEGTDSEGSGTKRHRATNTAGVDNEIE